MCVGRNSELCVCVCVLRRRCLFFSPAPAQYGRRCAPPWTAENMIPARGAAGAVKGSCAGNGLADRNVTGEET